jgi:hypothetical protein
VQLVVHRVNRIKRMLFQLDILTTALSPVASLIVYALSDLGTDRNLRSQALRLLSVGVRFEVFTAVTMENGAFWDVTPCGSCKNRRSGGT